MIYEFEGFHIDLLEVAAIMTKNPEVTTDDEPIGDIKVAILFAGSSTAKIELSLIPSKIGYKKIKDLIDAFYESREETEE